MPPGFCWLWPRRFLDHPQQLRTGLPGHWFHLPAATSKFFSNIIFAYLLGPSLLGFTPDLSHIPKAFLQRQPTWLLVPTPDWLNYYRTACHRARPTPCDDWFLLTFIMLLTGVMALVATGFTPANAISRAQLRWAIGGVAVGIGTFC